MYLLDFCNEIDKLSKTTIVIGDTSTQLAVIQ